MSNATSITLVGRAGTYPQVSMGSTGDRVSFRVVATERRFDKAIQDWVNGDEFGVTVICWKALATSVLAMVRKGDPIIVCGRISTRRFERDGATQYFTEVKADFVGFDVAKAGGRFTRNAFDAREPVDRTAGPTDSLSTDSPASTPHGQQASGPLAGSADSTARGAISVGEDQLSPVPEEFEDPWAPEGSDAEPEPELVPAS